MSRLIKTIPKMGGQEVRITLEELGRDDIEYLDMRIWTQDGKKTYRTKCGFSLGPRRLSELREAIDEAIEYFAQKKIKAQEKRQ